MERAYRHTKIIFTIGPATEGIEVITQLMNAGADICRLNMAHASHEWTRQTIANIRKASEIAGKDIAIMMDIKGPEIRTGDVDVPYNLSKGDQLDVYMSQTAMGNPLDHAPIYATYVNYPNLINDVNEGDALLIDSGHIQLRIMEKQADFLRCEVVIPGRLTSRRHVNLPGVYVSLPPLTEKDKGDIAVGIAENIEFFALSFVREAGDIVALRKILQEKDSQAKIIAKLEDQTAITNMEEIIIESDGLMVARGDLGVECPFEQLPIIQRTAVAMSIKNTKPVIVATHMLESMISSPLPTRAEVSDVANAVSEKADAIMLSAETTIGKYPIKCIEVMNSISCAMEEIAVTEYNKDLELCTPKTKILRSAVVLAQELNRAGIIAFTNTGLLTQVLSSLRPTKCPIFAFTENEAVYKQMHLLWGVYPFLSKFSNNPEITIEEAFKSLKATGLVETGNTMVVVTNIILGPSIRDSIQIRVIE